MELLDGVVDEYYHNVLLEKLLSQVDKEGRESIPMKEITNNKIDKYAIREWKKGIITKKGWKVLVKCKDRTQDRISLKDIIGSNPVKTTKYADDDNISEEPAFKWWANKVLVKKERILPRVKQSYWRSSHKFGGALYHSVKEADAIDEYNGNSFWRDSIDKELNNI